MYRMENQPTKSATDPIIQTECENTNGIFPKKEQKSLQAHRKPNNYKTQQKIKKKTKNNNEALKKEEQNLCYKIKSLKRKLTSYLRK